MLNASRHHRKNRIINAARLKPARGAQRLAASQEKSQARRSDVKISMTECSTPRGITGKIAMLASVLLKSSRECSTPRGITGKIADVARRQFDRQCRAQRLAASQEKSLSHTSKTATESCVLNASRHHRKNRSVDRRAFPLPRRCSTPRGITGKIALLPTPTSPPIVACSTPRGITGKIADVTGLTCVYSVVLNASRHHRKNRCYFPVTQNNILLSAQRLAASQEKSRAGVLGDLTMLVKCSTPRGITGKIALQQSS